MDAAPVGKLVVHEVHQPALINCGLHRQQLASPAGAGTAGVGLSLT